MLSSDTPQLASLVAAARSQHEAFLTGFGEASKKPAAATFGEALNIVQAREDFKRKKDGGKSKSKSKTAAALPESSNGSGSLATPEHSAFWLFVEGYLRDLTQDDIAFLQPYTGSLLDDPILLCPPLGFDDEVLLAEQSKAGAPSGLKAAPFGSAPSNEVEALQSLPGTSEQDADLGMGRKSRRLLSRFQKEAEARKAAVEAQQAQSETQAALAGLTADGKVADFLLQTCSPTDLSSLASQMAIAQGLQDPTGQPSRAEAAASCLLPMEGGAAAAESEGQSFNHILAWVCAQAEGEGAILGAPKALPEAGGMMGPARAQTIDTSRLRLGSRPAASGASPTSATAHSAGHAGYFSPAITANRTVPWNPQQPLMPTGNGAPGTMPPEHAAPGHVDPVNVAASSFIPGHQSGLHSNGAEQSAETGPACNSLIKAEDVRPAVATHIARPRNGDVSASRTGRDRPETVTTLPPAWPGGSNGPDSPSIPCQAQPQAQKAASLEASDVGQNGPRAQSSQDAAGLAGLLGHGQPFSQAAEGSGQHPFLPGVEDNEGSAAGLDPLQEALAAMLDSRPGQAQPTQGIAPPAGFSGKPYPILNPFEAFSALASVPTGRPPMPGLQQVASQGNSPAVLVSGRPSGGPTSFQPFSAAFHAPTDQPVSSDPQQPLGTPTSSGSHQVPLKQMDLSRPLAQHAPDMSRRQAADAQAGQASQATLGGYQPPPSSIGSQRKKLPAWFWDHHKLGIPSDAALHPHTARMLQQPLPSHAGEVVPPSKSKSQGSKAKSEWGDLTDSDSDAGSDGPGAKDELVDAEVDEAIQAQHLVDTEAPEEKTDDGATQPHQIVKPPLPKKLGPEPPRNAEVTPMAARPGSPATPLQSPFTSPQPSPLPAEPELDGKVHVDAEAALQERRMSGTLAGLSRGESPADLPSLAPQPSTSGGRAGSGVLKQDKAVAGRSSSGRNRSAVNYTLLAGRKEGGSGGTPKRTTPTRADGPDKPPKLSSSKSASAAGRKHGGPPSRKSGSKQQKASKATSKPAAPGELKVRSATAQANANCIGAGPPEGSLEEQWLQLERAANLLAEAPEDEILAEILMLQAELLQQAAVNRPRLLSVLEKAAADVSDRQAHAERRMRSEEYVRAYMMKVKTAKKVLKRERREILQREAQQTERASEQAAHRLAGMRSRGESAHKDRSRQKSAPAPKMESLDPHQINAPALDSEIIDALAERTEDEEALCAVCGGGVSEAPNVIVFCERCDLAVHQQCYHVSEIPDGEWLCWPCRLYEEEEAAKLVPKAVVRPPRWDPSAASARDAGGSRTVTCKLCPVRHGAFRQTIDGLYWVHQACAMWHPEAHVRNEPGARVIEGVPGSIRADRWTQCSICNRSDGAVVRCNYGHCATGFHPLCGRNVGLYLALREGGSKPTPRVYCCMHSDIQRRKDQQPGMGKGGKPDGAKGREARLAGLRELAAREDERAVLAGVRLELESLRIMCDRVSRRERLKREYQRHCQEAAVISLQLPELAWQVRQDRLNQPADALALEAGLSAPTQFPENPHQEDSLQHANQPPAVETPEESAPPEILQSGPDAAGKPDQNGSGLPEKVALDGPAAEHQPSEPDEAAQLPQQQQEQEQDAEQPPIQAVSNASLDGQTAEQRSAQSEPGSGRPQSGRPRSGRRQSRHAAVEDQSLQQQPDGQSAGALQPVQQQDENFAQQPSEQASERLPDNLTKKGKRPPRAPTQASKPKAAARQPPQRPPKRQAATRARSAAASGKPPADQASSPEAPEAAEAPSGSLQQSSADTDPAASDSENASKSEEPEASEEEPEKPVPARTAAHARQGKAVSKSAGAGKGKLRKLPRDSKSSQGKRGRAEPPATRISPRKSLPAGAKRPRPTPSGPAKASKQPGVGTRGKTRKSQIEPESMASPGRSTKRQRLQEGLSDADGAQQMDLETLMSEDEAAACNAQLLSAPLNAQLHVQYVPANTFNKSNAGEDS
ncbi:hypothetical protein WJX74_003131 [Apatococcus lobatus]|uniref:Uncharacterized protein n=1 Tax=Apatococcus lobatus TaxID=904363 RepID=A0AAW1S1U4_9CHLO